MKNTGMILSLPFIAAVLSFSGCTKAQNLYNAPQINITVTAVSKDGESTKTHVFERVEGGVNHTHVYWDESDKLQIFECVDGNYINNAVSSQTTLSEEGKSAIFQAAIKGDAPQGQNYSYVAVYPAGSASLSTEKNFWRVAIPQTQILSGNNLAPDADVLISTARSMDQRIQSGDNLDFTFIRIGTTVKLTLKGISAGEKISKIVLNTPVSCTGYSEFNPATGEIIKFVSTGHRRVTLNIDNIEATGTDSFWLRCLPGEWKPTSGSPLEIQVYTNKAVYTRTITSLLNPLKLENGGLTRISIGNLERRAYQEPSKIPYGYLEMPAPSDAEGLYQITHKATGSTYGPERNYTYLYNPDIYMSYWVAYPLTRNHFDQGRDGTFGYDPALDSNLQTDIKKGYGVEMATEYHGNNRYARGHQLPNGDRSAAAYSQMQAQTFYATNMTPQIDYGFNGAIWKSLETSVRESVPVADTLYVVTGAALRKAGCSEEIKTIRNVNDGKTLQVPNYYWKALLKVKRDSEGTITKAYAIGYWLPHKDTNNSDYDQFIVSVDTIEGFTGFDLFHNLPLDIQAAAENVQWSSTGAFRSESAL